jgi:hypothetical protein
MRRFRRLDVKRLTFSRGLLIAGGTLLIGAALGWIQPPPLCIVAVGIIGLGMFLAGLRKLETPDPCGDPKVRLSQLIASATELANTLAHFDNWWAAVLADEDFNDMLPDGRLTTHDWAMDTLLHMFAQFFSAAWTYQANCHKHRDRAEVIEWVDEVYEALTDDPGGPTDPTLMSPYLHTIAVRCTERWGDAEARPFQLAEFKDKMDDNPRFARDFKPLSKFLLEARPRTKTRARLKETEQAVERVKERLEKKGYRR